jgi:energy-coupling factor transporter ATP-binding protein EcfA2
LLLDVYFFFAGVPTSAGIAAGLAMPEGRRMSRQQQIDAARAKMKGKTPAGGKESTPRSSPTKARSAGPIAYFDSNRGGFWTQNSRDEWVQFTEASLRRVLKYNHFAEVTDKEAQYAIIDKKFIELQHEHDVVYAGSIAGYRAGVHEICGQRILVTSGPKLLQPKDGQWALLKAFLTDLLGDGVRVFYAWLKSALRSFYAGPSFRPGQMLAIAGPAGCGKSLLQNLITEILGGRSAKPYRYLTGETAFNSDLFGCEHLMVEDEAASTDLRVRRHFGSQLKNMIVNEVQSLHRKGRDALSVSPFWRITITLNDEPENLMVLPPLDESLKDKITILRAFVPKFPYAADDMAKRKEFRTRLSAELPAFLRFLQSFRIPEKMVNQRYGVAAFHDPDLLGELEDLSPEMKLLTLIDTLNIYGIDREPWEGTAAELEEKLLEKDRSGRCAKVLSYNTACGAYLARLKHRFPERISEKRTTQQGRIWTIRPRAT